MGKKWQSYVPYFLFFLFFIFVSISNIFDWDHFQASAESDLRSWMIWHEAPLWSYQFCGGVTRIGDPQAFGLSPLFLFHILFGSIWGWKFFVLASALLAVYFLEKIRSEFFPAAPPALSRMMIYGYVFSNFFLWHFHHGHMTFVLHLWVLGLCYYYLRVIHKKFTARDFAGSAAIVFCIFTSGFYHTSVFFGVPLAITCLIHLGIGFYRKAIRWKPLLLFVSSLLVGIALSAYKWLSVLNYQMFNPRTVAMNESVTIAQGLAHLLVPTFNYRFLGLFDPTTQYSIWEYSAFSVTSWIVLILVLTSTRAVIKSVKKIKYPALFPLILGLTTAVLYVGGDSSLYPFHWINHYLFHDSVRVVGRFAHNFVFSALLLGFYWFGEIRNKWTRQLSSPKVLLAGFALIALNFFSFSPTLYVPLLPWKLTSVPENASAEMRDVFITRKRSDRQSFMYEPLAQGFAVLNCYNPISRDMRVSLEFSPFIDSHQAKQFPFIDFEGKPSEQCWQGTYMTSNTIHVDPQCPKGCFTLNDLSPEDRRRFVFLKDIKIYCSK
jgi:hypothetical protein